jgi:2-oxo-4-hydroxy-4-carboxy-5-ureidoimidazoline decarboxylase
MIEEFNALPAPDAIADLVTCCATPRWAERVAAARPFADVPALRAAAAQAYRDLTWSQIRQAMDAHPRIGERDAGTGREARWSRTEQSAVIGLAEQLRAGNAAYEERFGHVFLINATGRDAEAVLAELRRRLANDAESERAEVRRELGEIVDLRVTRLVTG